MKNALGIITTLFLAHHLQGAIEWRDAKDLGYLGGAMAAGVIITYFGYSKLSPMALERDKFAAEQAEKARQNQKADAEKQKAEAAEKERLDTHIEFKKYRLLYDQEIRAAQKKEFSKDTLIAIAMSKHPLQHSRLRKHSDLLSTTIDRLYKMSQLLSTEEQNNLKLFVTDLESFRRAYNTKLAEDIQIEYEEAKHKEEQEKKEKRIIEKEERAEKRLIAREELKEQKLRAEIEAQKKTTDIYETVKNIGNSQDEMRQKMKSLEQHIAAQNCQLALVLETLQEAIKAGNAQLALRIINQIEELKKKMMNITVQATTSLVTPQAPSPFNPAAIAAMGAQACPAEPLDTQTVNPIPMPK